MSVLRAPDQFSPRRRGTSTTPTCGGCCCCCCCVGSVVGSSIALPLALVGLAQQADAGDAAAAQQAGQAAPPRRSRAGAVLAALAVPVALGLFLVLLAVFDGTSNDGLLMLTIGAFAIAVLAVMLVAAVKSARLPASDRLFPLVVLVLTALAFTIELFVAVAFFVGETLSWWLYLPVALVIAVLLGLVGRALGRRAKAS